MLIVAEYREKDLPVGQLTGYPGLSLQLKGGDPTISHNKRIIRKGNKENYKIYRSRRHPLKTLLHTSDELW